MMNFAGIPNDNLREGKPSSKEVHHETDSGQ